MFKFLFSSNKYDLKFRTAQCYKYYCILDEADKEEISILSDSELSTLIDTILREDDGNRDGYIDYAEFMLSSQT